MQNMLSGAYRNNRLSRKSRQTTLDAAFADYSARRGLMPNIVAGNRVRARNVE